MGQDCFTVYRIKNTDNLTLSQTMRNKQKQSISPSALMQKNMINKNIYSCYYKNVNGIKKMLKKTKSLKH